MYQSKQRLGDQSKSEPWIGHDTWLGSYERNPLCSLVSPKQASGEVRMWFNIHKQKLSKTLKGNFEDQFGRSVALHDISEFGDLNLEEQMLSYLSSNRRNKLQFVCGRFQLFMKRVNKKNKDFFGKSLISNSCEALVRYFQLQTRWMLEQEKNGYDEAFKSLFVSKAQLLDVLSEYSAKEAGHHKQSQRDNIKDMILRYVFFKTPWHGDITNQFYVAISDQQLRDIETWQDWPQDKREKHFERLCMQILLLSEGQLIIGCTTDFLDQNMIKYDRLRPLGTYVYSWIGFMYLDKEELTQISYADQAKHGRANDTQRSRRQVGASAMLPRRIPQFEKKEIVGSDGEKTTYSALTGFKIEHYAYLLTNYTDEQRLYGAVTAQRSHKINAKNFTHFLPKARLEPFNISHVKIQSLKYPRSNLQDMAKPLTQFDRNWRCMNEGSFHSKRFFTDKDRHSFKKDAYSMRCTFNCNMDDDVYKHCTSFPFAPQCYERNSDGFWVYSAELATEDNFKLFANDAMPDFYTVAAREVFNSKIEVFLIQSRRYLETDQKTGFENRNETMKALQRFEARQRLSNVLQMLPIVKMKLNSQQQRILNSSESLFILGRSGTGKTTTTVLRFFCQEAMYMAMRKQQRLLNAYSRMGQMKKYRDQKKQLPRLAAEDVQETTNVKMVFVTASPVLTNEVKQYYASLKSQLAAHLLVAQKGQAQKDDEDKEDGENKTEEVKAEEGDSSNKAAELLKAEEREKLLKFLEIKEQEIIQAEQVEQQLALPNKAANLRPHHFPLFLTVQKLIYMLDASLYNSFFSRKGDGTIIGMETSLGWHSEDRGVFMINQDFKQSDELKKQLQEFELQVLSGEKEEDFAEVGGADVQLDMITDIQEGIQNPLEHSEKPAAKGGSHYSEGGLDKEYRRVNQGNNYKYDEKTKRHKRVGIDEFPLCSEVTLEFFEEQFLPRIQRFMTKSLMKKLSPTFLWTEIMSVIKGSLHGKMIERYLSRVDYIHYGNKVLSRKEKSTIYYIFLKYEEWKLNVRAFDFLDVVNHIVQEKRDQRYCEKSRQWKYNSIHSISKSTFDYLIIDEVQDLYPKTIKLLLEHTKEQVVFAGDTAQTIAKGVSARISDMQDILHQKKILNTTKINLSINYRSQNSILQLANNVVKIIETVFPYSIDKMIEEVSERDGERPFLIDPVGDNLLCQFFFGKTVQETEAIQDDFSVIEDDEDLEEAAGKEKPAQNSLVGARSITPHFGASQVIIVREQAVKNELPEFMKSMLCLTVYESKGLEFDDVILFNFFAMGEIKSANWKFLQHIRESQGYRTWLPDWVLDIGPDEEEKHIDTLLKEQLAVYREERKAKMLAEAEEKKAALEELKKQEIEENGAAAELEQDPAAAAAQNQVEPAADAEEEKKEDDCQDDQDDEEEEEDPEEEKFVEKARKDIRKEFIKSKYDAAIAKFEADGENAQFIQQFNYQILDEKSNNQGEIQRRYQMLCTELKFLYVAITRPKLRLFIYDEDREARKPIEEIWTRIGAVQRVTADQIREQVEQRRLEAEAKKEARNGTLGETQCDQEQWKFQGLRFLKQKNYQQAIKCFRFSGAKNLALRCKAFIAAQKAQELLTQNDTSTWEFKRRSKFMTKNTKKRAINDIKTQNIETCRQFHQAGLAFEKADMQKFAASCYFTARSYSRAADIFKQLEQWSQVGECMMRIGKDRYRDAATFFEKGELILRAIECYEQINEWELLLHCLNRNQEKFGDNERQSLINKYVPIALNNIYQHYGMVERKEDMPQGDKGNVGEQVEKKIQDKYAVTNAIAEEEIDEYGQELQFEDEDDSDDDEDEEAKEEEEETADAENDDGKKAGSDDESEDEDDDNDQNFMSKGFQMETIIKAKYETAAAKSDEDGDDNSQAGEVGSQDGAADDDDSFEVIDSMSEGGRSQPDANANKDELDAEKREELLDKMKDLGDSFDHLSQYDPDDEFLKSNRSLSIIESIVSKNGRGTSALSESSEFSIISSGQIKSSINSIISDASRNQQGIQQINFIDEQEDDTYVQDVIAQKIIFYLSLWSDDMRKQLNELKEQGILHEAPVDAKNETIDETDFIIQMDDVDQDFVNLILDTLEVYEFYHMSLMMCKRYHLSGRQGRYLVLMCSKYSNLNRNRVTFSKLIKNQNLLEQQRACSLLAHEAIHNVLCLIDSDYLKMKDFGMELTEDNSLGVQAYSTILNLGYWKKLVYILEKRISLHLCLKFSDFKNYMLLMKVFMTQEEKIKHRVLLDTWTFKAQVKNFLLEKQRIMTRQVKKNTHSKLMDEFSQMIAENVAAVQLNQRSMQQMLELTQLVSDFLSLFVKDMPKEEKQAELTKKIDQVNELTNVCLRAFQTKSTDQSKYMAATMIFDMCFNIPIQQNQNRIMERIVFQLPQNRIVYRLFQETYDKLEKFTPLTKSDPVLEALYASNLISSLENEDYGESDMQNLFQSYADSYMLVSIHSNIIDEVISFQNMKVDHDIFMAGEARYKKLKYYFYDPAQRLDSISNYLNRSNITRSLDQFKSTERRVAFIADMDSQFIFVPKTWIRYILMIKIARVQAKLIYGHTHGSHLSSERFLMNGVLISKLRTLSHSGVNNVFSQAKLLSETVPSDFWKQLQFLQKINLTAKRLLEQFQVQNLIKQLAKAIRSNAESDSNYLLFSQGLLPVSPIRLLNVAKDTFSTNMIGGFDLWNEVCGHRLRRLGKSKDQVELVQRLLMSFSKFQNIDHYMPFLELFRKAKRKQKKKGPSEDYVILDSVKNAIDCHISLKSGNWSAAISKLLTLSSVKPVAGKEAIYDALKPSQKIEMVEFAGIIVLLMKFGSCYLPDYALYYLDSSTNFDGLYSDTEEISLLRQRSSLLRKKSSRGKSQPEEEKKEPVKIIGELNKLPSKPKFYDSYSEYATEYYDEVQTYKKPEDEEYDGEEDDEGYREEDKRALIERNFDSTKSIQKPEKELMQQMYENFLQQLVYLIELINDDDLSFTYKTEYTRIYNLLMAVVVNDKAKTQKVCQLLGQGFNRLMSGPMDDYFTELGVPEEWSTSVHASTLTVSTFKDQMDEFEEADVGFKWQWFGETTETTHVLDYYNSKTVAFGFYVTKIDITASQTEKAQVTIQEQERKLEQTQDRQLALRLASGRQITRAFRRILENRRLRMENEEMENQMQNFAIDKVAKRSHLKLETIMAHARVAKIEELTTLSQVDSVSFIEQLQVCYSKVNYMQELMIVKAFSNSIEISKAISFMRDLKALHEEFCQRAKLFAKEQAEILNNFDLMEQGEDPLAPMFGELRQQLTSLVAQINLWQNHVFDGSSSGLAIKKIMQSQMQVQQRLRLKWQKMKPTSKRQRLAMLKAKMLRK